MKIILGTPINGIPKPWHHYTIDGIMINAFEILSKNYHRRFENAHEIVSADISYSIWIDSGGYQFLRHGMVPNVDKICEIYTKFEDAQYCLNLDLPPSPTDSVDLARKKMYLSFENFQKLRSRLKDRVIPVLHYYHREDLCFEFLKKYLDYSCEVIAIGALVPYVLILKGVKGSSRLDAMQFLMKVKDILRDYKCKIHVLGLGSPVVTPILEIIGIDSTDSSTWRVKAAYGKVVLPGGGEVHVTSRTVNFGKRKATEKDLEYLKNFLIRTNFPLIHRFESIHTSFEYRALVNAYVISRSREKPRSQVFRKIYDIISRKIETDITKL